MKGRAIKVGDNISTDEIIPGRFTHLRSHLEELAQHLFEDLNPPLPPFQPGDFLVAGKNLGIGSSREHAPLIIKLRGFRAILAQSAARIFYRNAYNLGLPLLLCDTARIDQGDLLELDLAGGKVHNLTKKVSIPFGTVPGVMLRILEEGGIVPYIKRYGRFQP